jgi:hypothetical protein
MENVIDKLRKIMAHAASAREIGNLAEAEAFAAKAQELLLRHKLDMTEVEFAAEEAAEPVMSDVFSATETLDLPIKRTHDNWIGILMLACAKANFCKILKMRHSNTFSVVGRATDRQAATELFTYLSKACIEMAPNEADRNCIINQRRSYISSFKLGFASAIYHRIVHKQMELKAGAQEQGLIRIDQMEKAVEKKFKELYPYTTTGAPARAYNRSGFAAGKVYGQAVGINGTKRLGQ